MSAPTLDAPRADATGPIADAIRTGTMPGRLWIYSNYHCNLACGYCLTESSPRAPRRELDAGTMVELARQAEQLGFTGIGVTGGETILLPWLPEAIRKMAEHLPIVVLTNGTLFGDDRIELTAGMDHPHVALQISLDSHLPDVNDLARGPDNFRKVVEAVPRLLERGVRVRIATTTALAPDHRGLEPLRELVSSLGVPAEDHLVRPIVRRGRADQRAMGVVAGARDIPSELTVTADGAFWGSFGPTVRGNRLDTDLLLTRTILPLEVPAMALLAALDGVPEGNDAALGIH
jgi:uncharacterized Fe-S cluster-containing radical SAM superfamily protein